MLPPFPNKISLANTPTPLHLLKNISADIDGPNIWLKRDDWTGSSTSGNKIRKLEYLLADAVKQSADVVITCGGVQSNHCRATAMVCAQLGLDCHLILRGEQPVALEANTFLDALAGAKISCYPKSKWRDLENIFASHVQEYEENGRRAYCIPTGGSNDVGLWGYLDGARELASQIKMEQANFKYICCATGSGGTHAGVALGNFLLGSSIKVRAYAVCDSKEYFVKKGREDIAQWAEKYNVKMDVASVPLDICDQFIGEGYALADQNVIGTISYVARREGVVLDPVYTGKAFMGMMEDIKNGVFERDSDIVFIHTGGIFGVFPYADQFAFTSNNRR